MSCDLPRGAIFMTFRGPLDRRRPISLVRSSSF
jgi:hypothetical protein